MTLYPVDRTEEIVETALELIQIDTQNPPGETTAAIDAIDTTLSNHGLETERIIADPAKPNLFAQLNGQRDETLLFNGHVDTVPFTADSWTCDPLGERDGERLYGRGATDMKGPLAAMLRAFLVLAEADSKPPVNVAIAVVSDEETGGEAGVRALLDHEPNVSACVIGETTCEGGRHSITVADKGSIWLTLEARGEGAHGSRPMLGQNAIDELYEAIETLRARFGNKQLNIDPTVTPIIQESIEYYRSVIGERAATDLFSCPTINLGRFEGGEAINAVPERAEAEIDIRLPPGVQTPDTLSNIRSCIRDCDHVSITDLSWSTGTYERHDSALVTAVTKVTNQVTNERIYRRSGTGGGDAKKFRNHDIPTVEVGIGTDTAHAVDEFITTDALQTNAQLFTRLPTVFANTIE